MSSSSSLMQILAERVFLTIKQFKDVWKVSADTVEVRFSKKFRRDS